MKYKGLILLVLAKRRMFCVPLTLFPRRAWNIRKNDDEINNDDDDNNNTNNTTTKTTMTTMKIQTAITTTT